MKKRILLVEDSKVIRRSIKTLLEKYNLEIMEFNNAEDLFTNMEQCKEVNLMLLDIDLPGMDGLTAMEYFSQLSALNHIPVIIISGHAELSIVQKAVKLKVIDYVRKPYLAKQLLERIEKVIGSLTEPTE